MSDPCSSHFYKMHNGSLNITVSEGTKDSLSPCLSGDNRCLTSRLGVDMAEEVSPGGMESFSTSMSNNCRLGSEALLALSQHLRSVSHQPARRERLLKWAHPWLASLRTMHHPSRANSVADYLSHQGLDGGCILRKSSWSWISTGKPCRPACCIMGPGPGPAGLKQVTFWAYSRDDLPSFLQVMWEQINLPLRMSPGRLS